MTSDLLTFAASTTSFVKSPVLRSSGARKPGSSAREVLPYGTFRGAFVWVCEEGEADDDDGADIVVLRGMNRSRVLESHRYLDLAIAIEIMCGGLTK